MFGVELSNSEWAGLIGAAVVLLRILYGLVQVLWWYVTDALRPTRHPSLAAAVISLAGGAMAVGLLAAITDWPADGLRGAAYWVVAAFGWFLGLMLEFVIFF